MFRCRGSDFYGRRLLGTASVVFLMGRAVKRLICFFRGHRFVHHIDEYGLYWRWCRRCNPVLEQTR